MKNATIDDLKDQISIEEVLEELGGRVVSGSYGAWESATCPFHDDRNASASVNRVTGWFKCHACEEPRDGKAGDIIDMAMAHLGNHDVKAAMEWLRETFL